MRRFPILYTYTVIRQNRRKYLPHRPPRRLGSMGLYECECMPFGLCNAPPTFQRLMLNCLGELNLTYCLIYLDDVIIFSRTEEEHLEQMRVVFDQL